jgi:uncharacterized membrane protein
LEASTVAIEGTRPTRALLRWTLALLYLVAGDFHLARPASFLTIMPGWVPWPHAVVFATGLAELFAVPALLQPWWPRLRRAAGIGLALYAVCVFPANVNHLMLDMAKPHPSLGWGYHVPRMFAQPLLVWLALWVSGAIEWPFGRRR